MDATVTLIIGIAWTGPAIAQTTKDFVGTWTLGANLPKFASNNRTSGTAEENKAVVAGSLAHFGTYAVNEADKSFTFRVDNATSRTGKRPNRSVLL